MNDSSVGGSTFTPTGVAALTGPAVAKEFRRTGVLCVERALESSFCRSVIDSLARASMIEVESRDLRGTTRFLTLNGDELLGRAPALAPLYRRFGELVSALAGREYVPLDNPKVGLSLNYTPPGGGFVRHFDRNEMTVSLYLNRVEAGELEIWPDIVSPALDLLGRYKLPVALRLTRMRRALRVPPREGTAVIFSRRTVHGVAPVTGARARVSVIMAFDRPGVSFLDVPDYYGRGTQRVSLDPVQA